MSFAPDPVRPTILFDGVCNLCNGAVTWIIARDHRARFRFASLQSVAAKTLLAIAKAPSDLPDSIVLVDAAGVHTRSDAAIRIARRLGFPWMLAAIFLIIPRFIRDRIYAMIARNRYRWFGRRDTCMLPTAALRARFLDADEPPRVISDAELPAAAPVMRQSLVTLIPLRFTLAYLVVYMFPAPLDLVMVFLGLIQQYVAALGNFAMQWNIFIGALFEKYGTFWNGIVQQVATSVFDADASVLPAGSGDTTYNYVETFVDAMLALGITIAWTLIARTKPVHARTLDLIRTYVRWYLAVVMLGYGWHKVMPLQFGAIGPDDMLTTYGDSSPMGLLWRFMAASTAYQIFAGLGEVIGGSLLFWRRTTLLGALISGGVMLNVVMLNYCFDVPVKLFSSHLLLMCLFLIAPHAARLASVLVLNIPAQPVILRPFPFKHAWIRWPLSLLKIALIVVIGIMPAFQSYDSLYTFGMLKPRTSLHGVYRVESFTRDGIENRANEDDVRWVRLAIDDSGIGAIQRADGTSRRFQLAIDQSAKTFTITQRGTPEPATLAFVETDADTIEFTGTFEGGSVSVRASKQPDADNLTTRGFRWINEYPYNR